MGERRGMAIVNYENLMTVPKLLERHWIVAPHAPFIASQVALVKLVSVALKPGYFLEIVKLRKDKESAAETPESYSSAPASRSTPATSE